MSWLATIPEWIGTAVVGAVFAAVGYIAKDLLDRRKKKNLAVKENISNLSSLSKLLRVQKRIFDIQCDHRDKLFDSLEKDFPSAIQKYTGYDETFENLYDKFNKTQRELYTIIRSQTKNSLLPLNKKIQNLTDKIDPKLFGLSKWARFEFADDLETLNLHFTLWLAKYEDWIPNNPRHALVYLADEKEHGVGFPKGIEKKVDLILELISEDHRKKR